MDMDLEFHFQSADLIFNQINLKHLSPARLNHSREAAIIAVPQNYKAVSRRDGFAERFTAIWLRR